MRTIYEEERYGKEEVGKEKKRKVWGNEGEAKW